METTDHAAENGILAALPPDARDMKEKIQEVTLARGDVLIECGPEYGNVYFPHAGLISLLVELPDGTSVEAAVIGREGLVGHRYLADFDAAPTRAIVQADGRAARMTGRDFDALFGAGQAVRDILANFARAFLTQTLQTSACNALHGPEERLAKWLLQCADRIEGTIHLTHEYLGEMLALSRPTVSLTARTMQTAGLIRYSRGRVQITDRAGLEQIACPCYRVIKHAYDQLLPPLAPSAI